MSLLFSKQSLHFNSLILVQSSKLLKSSRFLFNMAQIQETLIFPAIRFVEFFVC